MHCIALWLLLVALQCVAKDHSQCLHVALINTEDSIEPLAIISIDTNFITEI